MNCIFCKIINNEIPSYKIFENKYTLAFLDINPNSEGHCIVIPKQHIDSFSQASNEIICEVSKTKLIVTKIYNQTLKPKGFNYVCNDGSEAFQEVFHYHEHIIPKYKKEEGYTFIINQVDKIDLETTLNKIKTYVG